MRVEGSHVTRPFTVVRSTLLLQNKEHYHVGRKRPLKQGMLLGKNTQIGHLYTTSIGAPKSARNSLLCRPKNVIGTESERDRVLIQQCYH